MNSGSGEFLSGYEEGYITLLGSGALNVDESKRSRSTTSRKSKGSKKDADETESDLNDLVSGEDPRLFASL